MQDVLEKFYLPSDAKKLQMDLLSIRESWQIYFYMFVS